MTRAAQDSPRTSVTRLGDTRRWRRGAHPQLPDQTDAERYARRPYSTAERAPTGDLCYRLSAPAVPGSPGSLDCGSGSPAWTTSHGGAVYQTPPPLRIERVCPIRTDGASRSRRARMAEQAVWFRGGAMRRAARCSCAVPTPCVLRRCEIARGVCCHGYPLGGPARQRALVVVASDCVP